MKISTSNRYKVHLVILNVSIFIISLLVAGLLTIPSTGVFANNLITGSTASLKLTIPPQNCDTTQPTCVVDSLDLHYMIIHSPVGVKLATMGVFQNDCNGTSILVGTTNQIAGGSNTGDMIKNVIMQKIPNNWVFCLFLSQNGKNQLFAQGNFTVSSDGLSASTQLHLITPPPFVGSTAALKLTVPPQNCDTTQPSCVLDLLNLSYIIVNSLKGIKLATVGVFQDNCNGTSMLVGTVNQIADGNNTGTIKENVTMQKIPNNLMFCLFLSQNGKSQLFAQGNFNVAADGLSAIANLQLAPNVSIQPTVEASVQPSVQPSPQPSMQPSPQPN